MTTSRVNVFLRKAVGFRYWMLDAGYWMLDAGYWMLVLDTGCWCWIGGWVLFYVINAEEK